jgi:putative transposase
VPRGNSTDTRPSNGAAKQTVLRRVEHRQPKGLNNRAEHSHRPTRQRARVRQRFKAPGQAQRLLAAFEPITGHFRLRRQRLTAAEHRRERRHRFRVWDEVSGAREVAEPGSADRSRPVQRRGEAP